MNQHAATFEETSALTKQIGYILGPLLFALTFLIAPPEHMSDAAWKVCGLAMWMASWWITEAAALAVTSLLPIAILPTLHISPLKAALAPYSSSIIYLIFGGLVISLAMQKCNLHVRIGLSILRAIGHGEKSVLAGIMIATAFMAMWISNTATAIMMLPMAVSMATLLAGESHKQNNFAKALVLGVVYSCVIGGLSSFIGSPVNAILIGFMKEHYGTEMNLSDWMRFGVPLMIALLILTWCMLTCFFLRRENLTCNTREMVCNAHKELPRMSREERAVSLIFALTALAWIFSPLIERTLSIQLDDAVIAMIGALLLFLTPLSPKLDRFALHWKDTHKLPWGVLVFFGGSMSLSAALTDTGVTDWLSHELAGLSGMSTLLIVVTVVLLLIAVSELMNNVATITAFLPILASMAGAMHIDPLLIMIPATLSASCAFMLPGASAANALAFSTGYLKIRDMIRPGFTLDLIATLMIALCSFTLVAWVYDIAL